MRFCSIVLLLGFLANSMIGQKEQDFQELMRRASADFAVPLETFLKVKKVIDNDIMSYHYRLDARQDPVEIRYKVIPSSDENPVISSPQITVTQIASTIASNEEEFGDIVFHRIQEEDLAPYNADFGVYAFLHPKMSFADTRHCKIQFLYAEGKGMICTFLLFDRTDLDLRKYEQNISFTEGS